MRIAFFFEVFYPTINGVVTSTVNLATNLKKRGHEVLFCAPKSRGFDSRNVHGIETYYLESVPFFAYPGMHVTLPWSYRVVGKIRRDHIDVLHFTGPFTLGINAINAAHRLDLPVVQTFHTMIADPSYIKYVTRMDLPHGELLTWQYIGLFVRESDVITCPSRYILEKVRRRFPEHRYVHISNGIDLNDFKRGADLQQVCRLWPQFNGKTFLYVGRLGYEKSVDVVIRAVAEAGKEDPEIRLAVVGDGPASEGLKELARTLSCEHRVFFTGRVEHDALLRSGLIHHARAFVTASRTEIQAMTVLEAIACGTPLILARVEAMEEIIDGNGLFFDPDDVGELARCLLRMACDDALHGEFRRRSIQMSACYDGAQVAARFEELYQSLVKKG
jgi:glycosyltransferase involved in cell wall biosynthesis